MTQNPPAQDKPTIVVESDFDGYFERRVREILDEIGETPAYGTIRVSATPYLGDAVQYRIENGELHLTFYSALRNGFGSLDWSLVADLIRGRRRVGGGIRDARKTP